MKNRYPGACTVCKAQVLPGQGTLHRDRGRWTVTHDHACCEENARLLARKTMIVLDDMESDISQLTTAVSDLGRLASAGWLDAQAGRSRVMSSYAARTMDRLELEEILDTHLPMCA